MNFKWTTQDGEIFEDNIGIEQKVPQFPQRKLPTWELKNQSTSSNLQSTKDDSLSKISQISNVENSDKQILHLIYEFKKTPNGLTKRELECNIIKNLIRQKKVIDRQEQYLLAMDWAVKYTAYLYENKNSRPTEIDNSTLVNEKNEILSSIRQNSDFVLVNDLVWMFLKQEYTGGPEIHYDKYLDQTKDKKEKRVSTISVPSMLAVPEVAVRARSHEPLTPKNDNHQPLKHSYEIPLVGFKNDQNFCYMHSGLQSLLCIPEFNYLFLNKVKIFYDKDAHMRKIMDSTLIISLLYLELIEYIRQREAREYIRVGNLRRLIQKKFNPKMQHDCLEFLLYLLSTMSDEFTALSRETKRVQLKGKFSDCNIVDYQFKGQVESRICCRNQPFLSLSLALNKSKDLKECLNDFFEEEIIKEYKCEKCQRIGPIQKKTYLAQLPKNIILHLKRFKFFPKQYKLSQGINYPLDGLSFNQYLSKNQNNYPIYRLRAIVIHQGGLEGGHYYSYGRRFHQWYKFNDSEVSKVSSKELNNLQAYLLFYSQVE